jgi:hypothetical protein
LQSSLVTTSNPSIDRPFLSVANAFDVPHRAPT